MSTHNIDESTPILIDLNPSGKLRQVSLGSQDLREKSAEAINSAMNMINKMAQRTINSLDNLSNKPSQVEVDFGVKFDVEHGALIAKVGGEASLNIKLIWKRDESS